jgi:hypothetical protein
MYSTPNRRKNAEPNWMPSNGTALAFITLCWANPICMLFLLSPILFSCAPSEFSLP